MIAAVAGLAGCGGEPATEPTTPPGGAARSAAAGEGAIFVEAAERTGLDFVHFNGMTGAYYMAEISGSGAALFDLEGDGDLDVYLVQGLLLGPGRTLEQALFPPRHPLPLTDRIYRNDLETRGALAFTDVTAESGLAALPSGYGMGVTAGDYDNDGHVDLYVTNLGPNRLLRNRGDGTFEETTAAAGVGDERWSVPAVFFDYDRDGWLDLYVGNYVDFPFDSPPICRDFSGAQDYCGPESFRPEPDRLFHNRGDGTFEEVTAAAGLIGGFGPALGAVATDFDGDGWLDLYVANDLAANNLWLNQGDGTFRDEALMAGAAVNRRGKAEASMGVDAADFDGDGDPDLFMTHLVTETNTLYRNDGSGLFDDVTEGSGLGAASIAYTSFGTAWIDYDLDGALDLFVASGAVRKIESLTRQGDPFPLHEPNQLFRNLGDGRFVEVTDAAGPALALSEVSRGAAFGDLDNDGAVDVLVANNNGPARLLLNRLGSGHRWLGLRLVGGSPPRDMLGAQAVLRRPGLPDLWRRVRVDGSFASANDPRLIFGLGGGPAAGPPAAPWIEVHWPDGSKEEWTDLAIDRYHTLRQGTGRRPAGSS